MQPKQQQVKLYQAHTELFQKRLQQYSAQQQFTNTKVQQIVNPIKPQMQQQNSILISLQQLSKKPVSQKSKREIDELSRIKQKIELSIEKQYVLDKLIKQQKSLYTNTQLLEEEARFENDQEKRFIAQKNQLQKQTENEISKNILQTSRQQSVTNSYEKQQPVAMEEIKEDIITNIETQEEKTQLNENNTQETMNQSEISNKQQDDQQFIIEQQILKDSIYMTDLQIENKSLEYRITQRETQIATQHEQVEEEIQYQQLEDNLPLITKNEEISTDKSQKSLNEQRNQSNNNQDVEQQNLFESGILHEYFTIKNSNCAYFKAANAMTVLKQCIIQDEVLQQLQLQIKGKLKLIEEDFNKNTQISLFIGYNREFIREIVHQGKFQIQSKNIVNCKQFEKEINTTNEQQLEDFIIKQEQLGNQFTSMLLDYQQFQKLCNQFVDEYIVQDQKYVVQYVNQIKNRIYLVIL